MQYILKNQKVTFYRIYFSRVDKKFSIYW